MDFNTNYQYENGFGDSGKAVMHPSPIPGDPRFYSHKFINPCAELDTKTDDELFVETWLSKIGKISLNLETPIEINQYQCKKPRQRQKAPMTIHTVKTALKKCIVIVEKLEATQEILKSNVSTMCSDDWKKRTIEIGNLKDELSSLMAQFNNQQILNALKYAIKERQRKRANQRRNKIERRRRRAETAKERAEAHKQIDLWLDNMKEQVEKAKAEENMKKDADCVLAEVTRKKAEARKQISLVTALTKLRRIRQIGAVRCGEKLSEEDNAAFNKTSESLMRIWENRMNTYQKEEQVLKVMLEQTASDDIRLSIVNREKKIVQDWEHVLFGTHYVPSPIYWGLTSADRDLETFIAIRKSWDTFLSDSDDKGSCIPLGWVLPSADTSNTDWNKYLQ